MIIKGRGICLVTSTLSNGFLLTAVKTAMNFHRWLNLRAFYTQRAVDANLQEINSFSFAIILLFLFMLYFFSYKMRFQNLFQEYLSE